MQCGKIIFKVVNLGDEANASLAMKYNAFTSSLFINCIKDGTDHIVEVTDIWATTLNKEGFVNRVKSKIEYYLTGEKP